MQKEASFWNRLNWNPVLPAICAALWVRRMIRLDWEWSFFTIAWLVVNLLWLGGAIVNVLTGGKFVRDLYSDDNDDEDPDNYVVPDSFAEYERKLKRPTSFSATLKRALGEDAIFRMEIMRSGVREIEDIDDAKGVVAAYKQLLREKNPEAVKVMGLFLRVGSQQVFNFFEAKGLPLVSERRRSLGRSKEDVEEILGIYKVYCAFRHTEAFPEIAAATSDPEMNGGYEWSGVFEYGQDEDDDILTFIRKGNGGLPTGMAGIAYLDRINELSLKGELANHPFSSDAGVARLTEYLTGKNPDEFSYAVSAAVALAFITHPRTNDLFSMALRHPDPDVGIEAAWAGAKTGKKEQIDRLAEMAMDWKTGYKAQRYLHELGLEMHIPLSATASTHIALCQLASWLGHPNELGKMPDVLEIVDHREIFWPACGARRVMTILKWTLDGESGIGTTGGTTTWCFFGESDEANWPPLDIYAKHSNWQMKKE
jgi:hypothetical protein